MSRTTLPSLALLAAASACGGTPHVASTESFCDLVGAGKLAAASEVAHTALLAGPRGPRVNGAGVAANTYDDRGRLGTWLQQQKCVAKVNVPTGLVETMPPIREIAFVITDAAGEIRECAVDLRLAPDSPLAIHPRDATTGATDLRCTQLPARTAH